MSSACCRRSLPDNRRSGISRKTRSPCLNLAVATTPKPLPRSLHTSMPAKGKLTNADNGSAAAPEEAELDDADDDSEAVPGVALSAVPIGAWSRRGEASEWNADQLD